MLLATSVILRRFFFLPMSESMDMSIELTLIASLFSRFLDLCSKILECLDVKSNVMSNFIVVRYASRTTINTGVILIATTEKLREKKWKQVVPLTLMTLIFECRLQRWPIIRGVVSRKDKPVYSPARTFSAAPETCPSSCCTHRPCYLDLFRKK